MLLNFPQYIGRSTTKSYPAQNTNSAKVRNSGFPTQRTTESQDSLGTLTLLQIKILKPQEDLKVTTKSEVTKIQGQVSILPSESSTAPGTAQGRCLLT